MMNIPPSEAKKLLLWEYEALLWNWNESHSTDADLAPPDPEQWAAMRGKINADPRLTGPAPGNYILDVGSRDET
jgi:hypothetical protein